MKINEKQYPNPMACNSFQNTRNVMTQEITVQKALNTPPYFAIGRVRLTHFPINFPECKLKADISRVIYSPNSSVI